ncbi:3-oxoadipate enol-lactonase [Actinorugispora endophytica]|uniref:3-oxoadipate enol-lactonase n=1 Tax=Actinorugispora endophytica TaxID=1605990 RepID=A0A4R6UZL3_9ACTN|nr:3-oxoadipate enol-lactonase [Actinorugispora endophytica]TDQ51579.1 3-oxoadipate enol-lactonase [Actinorugispora endophytica]
MSVDVHYTVDGPEDAPVVVLSGSLGSNLGMWDPQMAGLTGDFRVVRYDIRGHGGSPVPPGPYSMADLGSDVVRLMDRLKVRRAHFAGLSLGGMTGMWLGAHAPERIDRLALLCTSPLLGTPEAWAERAGLVRAEGPAAVAPGVVGRWFTPAYAEREPDTVALFAEMIADTPAEGYAGCCDAIGRMDLRPDLPAITAPTLVVGGFDDPSTPPDQAELIAASIPDSRLEIVPDAAHLASWEQATVVNELLIEHFGK